MRIINNKSTKVLERWDFQCWNAGALPSSPGHHVVHVRPFFHGLCQVICENSVSAKEVKNYSFHNKMATVFPCGRIQTRFGFLASQFSLDTLNVHTNMHMCIWNLDLEKDWHLWVISHVETDDRLYAMSYCPLVFTSPTVPSFGVTSSNSFGVW